MKTCPFCHLPPERIVAEDGPCLAIRDLYPVSDGHTLILTRRHIASFREMTGEEWAAVQRLSQRIADGLQGKDTTVRGFNLGINDGPYAGQTIPHAHVHLIPRREGDVQQPRGGVRGVIPCRRNYPKSS